MNELHTIQPNIEPEKPQQAEFLGVWKPPVVNQENIKGGQDKEQVDFINLMKLQQFFGLNTPTFDERELVTNIFNFFNKQEFQSLNDVFLEIQRVEQKIGATPLGLNRMQHIWNYLKILSQISQYDDLRVSMEKNG